MAEKPPARPNGRPKADTPGSRVTTWMRSPDHDRLIAIANREAKSISAVVRDLLRLKLR